MCRLGVSSLFPVIFMVNNSMGQAAQPVISYNYGLQRSDKTRLALNISMRTVLIYVVVIVLVSLLLPRFFGIRGAWLAVPTSEILTMLVALLLLRPVKTK